MGSTKNSVEHLPVCFDLLLKGEWIGAGRGRKAPKKSPLPAPPLGECYRSVDFRHFWNAEGGADGLCGFLASSDNGPEMGQLAD